MSRRLTVAGIWELPWDLIPHDKRLGGAPANFAFHCYPLGAKAYPVRCGGRDRVATFVCSQEGATPALPEHLIPL